MQSHLKRNSTSLPCHLTSENSQGFALRVPLDLSDNRQPLCCVYFLVPNSMKKNRTIEEIKADLQEAKQKIKDIQDHGNAVISKYDLMMGYDAEYYLRPTSCIFAHVSWYENELKEATKHGEQLNLF